MLPFVDPKYNGLTERQKSIIFVAANFSESFLRFIPRQIKNYPSHGIDHTLNIIELTNKFLDRWGITLRRDEKFLLYLAAWLHDIGCIRVRKNHNRKSIQLLEENESLCNLLNSMDNELFLNLCDIIRCHSKSNSRTNGIEKVPKKRGKIRAQFICSIFRLMDACEITKSKCPIEVYKEIKSSFKDADAIEFWEGHMNITDVVFEKPRIVVYHKNFRNSQRIISELKAEILSVKDIFRENKTVLPKVIKKLHK
jgi:hypothetical protein